jgi:hypothetical protein
VSVAREERMRIDRLALITLGLAVLVLALAAPGAALAGLGPPSPAPAFAKRECVRYTVVKGPSGPAARCIEHKTQTLRLVAARPRSNTLGSSYQTSAGTRRQGGGAPNRSQPGSLSPGAVPDALPTRRSSQTVASPSRSSNGRPLVIGLAIIAACALIGAATLLLARKPVARRRDRRARSGLVAGPRS